VLSLIKELKALRDHALSHHAQTKRVARIRASRVYFTLGQRMTMAGRKPSVSLARSLQSRRSTGLHGRVKRVHLTALLPTLSYSNP